MIKLIKLLELEKPQNIYAPEQEPGEAPEKDLMKQGTVPIFKAKVEFRAFSLGRKAFFLYHIVSNYKFIHLIQKLNIGYTN